MYRYWIAGIAENWADTSNWSVSSGGSGGASLPSIDTTAVFDTSGIGDCTLDVPIHVAGLQLSSGYTGTFSQNNYEMLIRDAGGSFLDGIFQGSGANIRVAGDLFIGGSCQFTSTDATLSCDSTFTYSPVTGSFSHNNGIISLDGTGCTFDASGMHTYILQFNATDGKLNSSCYAEKFLILNDGYINQGVIGSGVHVLNDMSCRANYNEWGESNNFNVIFDGTSKQVLYNEYGCVLPTVIVDKTDSSVMCGVESVYVICEGDSPIFIRGDFLLYDGTFNMNNHDIQLGS